MILDLILGALLTLALFWVAVAVLVERPSRASIRTIARLLPDTIRLMWTLSRDHKAPRSVRWRLLAALAYDVQPINLIPNFVPVLGLADNAIIAASALRSAMRRAGPELVCRHWRGSPDELAVLYEVARLGTRRRAQGDPEPSGSETMSWARATLPVASHPAMRSVRLAR